MQEYNEKIELLMENDDFMEKLLACISFEDVKNLFENENFTLTNDEIKQIHDALNENDELNDTQLESVHGGCGVGLALVVITAIGIYKIKKYQMEKAKRR